MARYNNSTSDFLIILAVLFFPPLGVFLLLGCGHEVLVAIGLSILGWFPGVFYAMYLYLETGGSRNLNATRRVELAKNRYKSSQYRRPAATSRPSAATRATSSTLAGAQTEGIREAASNAPRLPRRPPMKRTMREGRSTKQTSPPARGSKEQGNVQSVVVQEDSTNSPASNGSGEAAVVQSDSSGALVLPATAETQPSQSQSVGKKDKVSGFLGGIFTSSAAFKKAPIEAAAEPESRVAEKAATVPNSRSSQSSPAPGTPGQSAIVNPRITSIKAVKQTPNEEE